MFERLIEQLLNSIPGSSTSTVYALGGTDGSGADSSVDMIATCPHGGGVQMTQNMPESVEQAATVGIV